MKNWYWCPGIERQEIYVGKQKTFQRVFGLCLFAFGGTIYFGRKCWRIRIAVPK
jgi:hypothetical protein